VRRYLSIFNILKINNGESEFFILENKSLINRIKTNTSILVEKNNDIKINSIEGTRQK